MTSSAPNIPTEPAVPSFPQTTGRAKGYEKKAVDAFLARARSAFETDDDTALTAEAVRTAAFPLVRHGYSISAVDAALGRVEDAFAAREREHSVNSDGAGAWVERTRSEAQQILDRLNRPRGHRFARVALLRYGYRIDEVDLVSDKIAGYLASGQPVTVEQVRSVAFRMQRRGYREAQVDEVLDAVVEVMLAVG
jgi:DivIVA domain-containing protein